LQLVISAAKVLVFVLVTKMSLPLLLLLFRQHRLVMEPAKRFSMRRVLCFISVFSSITNTTKFLELVSEQKHT